MYLSSHIGIKIYYIVLALARENAEKISRIRD